MKLLLKLLANIGRSFGISSPSDNARRSHAKKESQDAQASAHSVSSHESGSKES